MLSFSIDGTQLIVHLSDKLISLNRKELKRLKILREQINYVRTQHYRLGLRQSYEASERAVRELEAICLEVRFLIRELLAGALDKSLKQLIESVVAGLKNALDYILRSLIKTLGQTLLLDLISRIIDVPIKCHSYIINIIELLVFYYCLTILVVIYRAYFR